MSIPIGTVIATVRELDWLGCHSQSDVSSRLARAGLQVGRLNTIWIPDSGGLRYVWPLHGYAANGRESAEVFFFPARAVVTLRVNRKEEAHCCLRAWVLQHEMSVQTNGSSSVVSAGEDWSYWNDQEYQVVTKGPLLGVAHRICGSCSL